MAQLLRTLTLPQDPGPIFSSHMVGSQPSVTPARGNLIPSSDCQISSIQPVHRHKADKTLIHNKIDHIIENNLQTMQFPSKSQ